MIAIGFIIFWGCVTALLVMEIKRCNRIVKHNKKICMKQEEPKQDYKPNSCDIIFETAALIENKQETLEEAAHRILTQYGIKSIGQSIGVIKVQELMVEMAKWQAERMYSVEDMKEAFYEGWILRGSGASFRDALEKWFEQFKKK